MIPTTGAAEIPFFLAGPLEDDGLFLGHIDPADRVLDHFVLYFSGGFFTGEFGGGKKLPRQTENQPPEEDQYEPSEPHGIVYFLSVRLNSPAPSIFKADDGLTASFPFFLEVEDGLLQDRMLVIRGDLRPRFEDKPPLVRPRMGEDQFLRL